MDDKKLDNSLFEDKKYDESLFEDSKFDQSDISKLNNTPIGDDASRFYQPKEDQLEQDLRTLGGITGGAVAGKGVELGLDKLGVKGINDRITPLLESLAAHRVGVFSTPSGKHFVKEALSQMGEPSGFVTPETLGKVAYQQGLGGRPFTSSKTLLEEAGKKLSKNVEDTDILLSKLQGISEPEFRFDKNLEDIIRREGKLDPRKLFENVGDRSKDLINQNVSNFTGEDKLGQVFKRTKDILADKYKTLEPSADIEDSLARILEKKQDKFIGSPSTLKLEKQKRAISDPNLFDRTAKTFAKNEFNKAQRQALKDFVEKDLMTTGEKLGLGTAEDLLQQFRYGIDPNVIGGKQLSGNLGVIKDMLKDKEIKDLYSSGIDLTDAMKTSAFGPTPALMLKGSKKFGAGLAGEALERFKNLPKLPVIGAVLGAAMTAGGAKAESPEMSWSEAISKGVQEEGLETLIPGGVQGVGPKSGASRELESGDISAYSKLQKEMEAQNQFQDREDILNKFDELYRRQQEERPLSDRINDLLKVKPEQNQKSIFNFNQKDVEQRLNELSSQPDKASQLLSQELAKIEPNNEEDRTRKLFALQQNPMYRKLLGEV